VAKVKWWSERNVISWRPLQLVNRNCVRVCSVESSVNCSLKLIWDTVLHVTKNSGALTDFGWPWCWCILSLDTSQSPVHLFRDEPKSFVLKTFHFPFFVISVVLFFLFISTCLVFLIQLLNLCDRFLKRVLILKLLHDKADFPTPTLQYSESVTNGRDRF
jgi:hypothetical protein